MLRLCKDNEQGGKQKEVKEKVEAIPWVKGQDKGDRFLERLHHLFLLNLFVFGTKMSIFLWLKT